MVISVQTAKQIYRDAIDARASDGESTAWWNEVTDEMQAVLSARTLTEAAMVIEWWHHDWTAASDTSRDAAKRIREAGRRLRPKH